MESACAPPPDAEPPRLRDAATDASWVVAWLAADSTAERLIAPCNDVGLLSEEYDPRTQRQLGNFPQAFSHIALINTAFNLSRAEKPAEQRSDLPKGTAQAAKAIAPA